MNYDLSGHGERTLMDDEGMSTMFTLMEEMQLKSVNVIVTRIDYIV